jgi:hypothetical protein
MSRANLITRLINETHGKKKISVEQLDLLVEKVNKKHLHEIGLNLNQVRGHALKRVNDPRNVPPISIRELEPILIEAVKEHGKRLSEMKITRPHSEVFVAPGNLNIACIVDPFSRYGYKYDVEIQTVMRKKHWETRDTKYFL